MIQLQGEPPTIELKKRSYAAIVIEITFDLRSRAIIKVLPFVSASEMNPVNHTQFLPNEVLLTSEEHSIRLEDIISKVEVKSEIEVKSEVEDKSEFEDKSKADITSEDPNQPESSGSVSIKNPFNTSGDSIETPLRQDSGLICHRATDHFKRIISEKFLFLDWILLLKENPANAIEFVAERTAIIISPKKLLTPRKNARSPLKNLPFNSGPQTPTKSLTQRLNTIESPKRKYYEEESSSSSDDFEDQDDSSSSSDSDLSEDEEPKPPRKVARGTLKKYVKKSPQKRLSEKSPLKTPTLNPATPLKTRKILTPLTTPRKKLKSAEGIDALKQVSEVLSPLKIGFKVKTGVSLASLPSLSRRDSNPHEKLSTSAEAFRELKEKLHSSTRIELLPCREEEFQEVYMNLESAVMEKMGCCLYVSGTPGVGKTATIREAVASLKDNVADGYVDDFDYLEINSLKLLSPMSAYEKLWEHLSGIKVTPANASLLLEEYFSRKDIEETRKCLVVMIDELDQLVTKNQDVMYNFFNWPTYTHSRFIVVAVANTMDLPERALSNKIASRLGLRRIAFRGYTEQDLGIIIAHRLTLLSEENKRKVNISQDAMKFASKKVALVSGDARRALAICRRAVEIAEDDYLHTTDTSGVPEQEQCYSVKITHIGMAISETVNSPISQLLHSLPFSSKLLLAGVLLRIRRSGRGENPLGDIIDEMRNCMNLLVTKTSTDIFQNFKTAASLKSTLYTDSLIDGTVSKVRVAGISAIVNGLVEMGVLLQQQLTSERYRMISLNIADDEILAVLKKDPEIASML